MRPATAFDAPRIARLEAQLFAGESPWSTQVVAAELEHPATWYVVEEIEGQLVGYAGLARTGPLDDPEFEVHTIGVDPQAQGKGLGRKLLRALLEQTTGPVFLEVRTTNEPAIALYESEGFERLGVRRNYYQPSGADAYTMRRPASGKEDQ